jgi:hypothetical protein
MSEKKELELRHGDIPAIAEITGYSDSMVKQVLSGDRNNPTILEAAEMLVSMRNALKAQFSPLRHTA